jgi:hypothetical protein
MKTYYSDIKFSLESGMEMQGQSNYKLYHNKENLIIIFSLSIGIWFLCLYQMNIKNYITILLKIRG